MYVIKFNSTIDDVSLARNRLECPADPARRNCYNPEMSRSSKPVV